MYRTKTKAKKLAAAARWVVSEEFVKDVNL
jgi:hypothetical protein